ncbi:HD domain-containing protein [Desulfovibrionales bacterium]
MNRKKTFIRDLRPGQDVSDIFALVQAQRKEAKNGPYWHLTLVDCTGSMEARIWFPHSQQVPELQAEDFILITGQAALFKDQLQLNIVEATRVDVQTDQLDLRDFIPSSPVPADQLLESIEHLLQKEIAYAPWRILCRKILQDQTVRSMLLTAPGAKAVHHAYAGGLLEHTLGVMRVCLALCTVYPQSDKELLLVGALLHDLGKAVELSHGISREYTDAGRLLGHIYLGLELIEPFLAKAKIPPELGLHLKHLLISHHGELEFGSPRRPKTVEAFILHYADNLDAKINTIEAALGQTATEEPGEPESYWSDYQRSLSRYVFQPRRTPDTEKATASAPQQESGQKQRTMQLVTPVQE